MHATGELSKFCVKIVGEGRPCCPVTNPRRDTEFVGSGFVG